MKQIIVLLWLLVVFNSCCDILCKREKHANNIIEQVELFVEQNKRLPVNLNEIGIKERENDLSYYKKITDNEYEIWYGIDLGTSKIYNSKTKKWRIE